MLRLGLVDFDSSHSIEYTRRFNHCGVDADQNVDGARVTLACVGESTISPERVPGFVKQVEACGVDFVDSPEQMLGQIDAVMVLSICGDDHLRRARCFLEAGVPTYVDKPFAGNYRDATTLVELSRRHNAPMMTSSSLRYSEEFSSFLKRLPALGKTNGAVTWGPAKRHPGNPGLLHYAIHAVEALYTILGPGCEEVATIWSEESEVVTGRWFDGRLGSVRGLRTGSTAYGATVFCDGGIVSAPICARFAYRNLCRAMLETFTTGKPSVPHETSLEIMRFAFAALESEHQGGRPIRLESISA